MLVKKLQDEYLVATFPTCFKKVIPVLNANGIICIDKSSILKSKNFSICNSLSPLLVSTPDEIDLPLILI